MRRSRGSYRYINYIFSFSLVLTFAILMALLIYSGANSYKNVKEHTDISFNASTALGYVINKIHGNDVNGVEIGEVNGGEYISLNYGEAGYVTYVYCYEGKLYECLAKSDSELTMGMGEVICELTDMNIEKKDNGLIRIVLNDNDDSYEAYVYINSGIQ